MKYIINKNGNYGIINPIPEGMLAAPLEKYLQYERQGKQFMPNPLWAIVKLYKRKTGSFPWGLIKKVERIMDKYCALHQHTFEITFKPKEVVMEKIPDLRPYQKDAVASLVKHNGGILCMPTGSGKTITVIEYLKLMNVPSLVIVPTKDIRSQWQKYGLKNVLVSTYQNPQLRNKGFIEQFSILVFDEVHHVAAKSLYTLAMKVSTQCILVGCSATVKREDGEDMRINAALGDIVYEISRAELIRQGWIANAKVIYLRPVFTDTGRFMDYQEVYGSQIVNNTDRNRRIIDVAFKEYLNNRKILILVSHIEHGQTLYDYAEIYKLTSNKKPNIVFMNGKSKNRDQDMSKYDIIIATPIYDEGYDLPALDCLILAAGGKSSIKLTQRIGRVLRIKDDGGSAIIYDLIDSPKYLKTHYLRRRRLLEEEFEVIDDQLKLV